MKTTNFITLKDERTGKNYGVSVFDESKKDIALIKLREKMDYDYFESLPAKDRVSQKKHPLDFTCPFCLEKTKVSSRKEKVTTGFLFFISTCLIDVFKCHKCNKEFFAEDLRIEKDRKWRNNNVIENFENWKDAKAQGKNPPEFMSIDKVDEFVLSSFTQ